jgi:hypothetical protein
VSSDEGPGASSEDLHPAGGARFIFTREGEDAPPRYRVEVHFPGTRTWSGTLDWLDGRARLSPGLEDDDDHWAREIAISLARVLKRTPKRKLIRWRAPR